MLKSRFSKDEDYLEKLNVEAEAIDYFSSLRKAIKEIFNEPLLALQSPLYCSKYFPFDSLHVTCKLQHIPAVGSLAELRIYYGILI